MTQEEKSLLLKDLCSRLPYGVKLKHIPSGEDTVLEMIGCGVIDGDIHDLVENFRPYLRPISSMTEEEKKELGRISCEGNIEHKYGIFYRSQDYLNLIHVDYRGLIDKGLALEAPEEMYDLKEK